MNVSSVKAIHYNKIVDNRILTLEILENTTTDNSYVPGSFLFTVLFILIGNRLTRLWEIHENLNQGQHYLSAFIIYMRALILTILFFKIAEFYAHLQSLFSNRGDV